MFERHLICMKENGHLDGLNAGCAGCYIIVHLSYQNYDIISIVVCWYYGYCYTVFLCMRRLL